MTLQRGAGARQLRILVRQFQEIVDNPAARRPIVADQHLGGAPMHVFDGSEPRQPEGFARDDRGQRQRRAQGKRQSEIAETFAAGEQVLDQMRDAKAKAEQDQTAHRGPEHRTPAQAASCRNQRRAGRHRQQRRIGFRLDVHGAAGRPAGIVRIHHDDGGVVEFERGRPPVRRSLAHCNLSPIRN